MARSLENPWIRRTRWLTQALIISGALNIGLVATFIYFVICDRQESLSIALTPVDKKHLGTLESNEKVLYAYSFLPYQELLLRLDNRDRVEGGLLKRDIALACLVAFHHFNLEQALSGWALQKRQITLCNADGSESMEVGVYPGLSNDQFQAIVQYARTEKWPFTAQGLFYEIKRSNSPYDPFLVEAFSLSSEFCAVQTLFVKSGLPLPSPLLLDLLCQGNWKNIADLIALQRQALDFSVERRRSFLFQYLDQHSSIASQIVLSSDLDFIIKHLDDAHVLMILEIVLSKIATERFHKQLPDFEALAKGLLDSPRTDLVWKKSAEILYGLLQESVPEPYDHNRVLARFAPQLLPQDAGRLMVQVESGLKEMVPPIRPEKKIHRVEVGDSLWKIARQYRVTIDEIMKCNHLESERLRVGKQLEIPEQSSSNIVLN